MGALIMTQHHNDDARMSELYAERAAGGKHEVWVSRFTEYGQTWVDDWWPIGSHEPFAQNKEYRLKQPKPKELEVWVGNCRYMGLILSDKMICMEVDGRRPGRDRVLDALNIPVGQQRKYKLVPVEDGE